MKSSNKFKVYCRNHKFLCRLVISVLIILILYISSWKFVYCYYNRFENAGIFGDSFGAVNALFSGLAFAILIITLIMQKEELALQRKELQCQIEETAKTTKELRGQKESMNLQKFENKFFQLLLIHTQKSKDRNEYYAFSDICNDIREKWKIFSEARFKNEFNGDNLKKLLRCYRDKLTEHRHEKFVVINDYFLSIFFIIDFVEKANEIESEDDKKFYINYLRLQLSEYELMVLGIFGINDEKNNFKSIIEKYRLLKNYVFREDFKMINENLIKKYDHLDKIWQDKLSEFDL